MKIIVGGCPLPNAAEIAESQGADGFAADALEAVGVRKCARGVKKMSLDS